MLPDEGVFHPGSLAQSALRRWPWLIACVVLGGLAGLGFSSLRPAVYEAQAVLGVSLDYGITLPLALIVEDRALSRVSGLVLSDSTLDALLETIPESERSARGWAGAASLRPALRIDRRLAEWGLTVADRDPEFAAQVAQAWAATALAAISDARQHAWQAAELLEGKFAVSCTPAPTPASGLPSDSYLCQAYPQDIEADAVGTELERELAEARGILPNLQVELQREASVPGRPVLWGRGLLILGGSAAGLLVGLLVVMIPHATGSRPRSQS